MAGVTSVIIKDDKLIFYIDDVISFIIVFLCYNVFLDSLLNLQNWLFLYCICTSYHSCYYTIYSISTRR